MRKLFLFIIPLLLFNCKPPNDTQFSTEALDAPIITPNNTTISLTDILQKHQGKTIVIDVWASWCGDCIKGLPKLKNIQEKYPNATYVFISLDRSQRAWKNGIKRFSIKGDHYYVEGGWKSIFAENIHLDWIPRYIAIDSTGKVVVYRAIKADDTDLVNILENQNNNK